MYCETHDHYTEKSCPHCVDAATRVRKFETGATRNSEEGKYDYEGFLSPLVIERFGQYMHKHRLQADGSVRSADNWQRGFGLDVCMKSGWRHFHDWWKVHRGWPSKEDIEESICALIFNAQAYLHERLRERLLKSSPDQERRT